MVSERFDSIARLVFLHTSRRELIVRAVSSLVAPFFFALSDESAEGKKKRKRKKPCRCGACHQCRNGRCVASSDDITCNGDGRCLNGQCNAEPSCTSAGFGCSLDFPETCCSTVCIPTGPFNAACQPGGAGQECKAADDCGSGRCVGYRCLQ